MAKTKRLSVYLTLILAITLAAVFPARALACGPAVALAAPLVGGAVTGITGIITTVGSALGLIKMAKDTVGPANMGHVEPVCTNPGCLAHNPAGASYAQPAYGDPGYQYRAENSPRPGPLEPSGPTPY